MDHISVEDISKLMFLSARQINRLMIQEFKQTFHEYLLDYRINTAIRLIKDTYLSIQEIAYKSGFSSHYYMYQVFRGKGLDTPLRIRKRK